MSRVDLRDEIHQYIDKADDRVLQLIYGMIQADLSEEDYELSDTHKQILEQRLAAHKSNPKTGSNWQEAKERISNQI